MISYTQTPPVTIRARLLWPIASLGFAAFMWWGISMASSSAAQTLQYMSPFLILSLFAWVWWFRSGIHVSQAGVTRQGLLGSAVATWEEMECIRGILWREVNTAGQPVVDTPQFVLVLKSGERIGLGGILFPSKRILRLLEFLLAESPVEFKAVQDAKGRTYWKNAGFKES